MTSTADHRERKGYVFSEKTKKRLAFIKIACKVIVLQAYKVLNGF